MRWVLEEVVELCLLQATWKIGHCHESRGLPLAHFAEVGHFFFSLAGVEGVILPLHFLLECHVFAQPELKFVERFCLVQQSFLHHRYNLRGDFAGGSLGNFGIFELKLGILFLRYSIEFSERHLKLSLELQSLASTHALRLAAQGALRLFYWTLYFQERVPLF